MTPCLTNGIRPEVKLDIIEVESQMEDSKSMILHSQWVTAQIIIPTEDKL